MAGGAIGAVSRFWLASLVQSRAGDVFPFGTLTVNAIGSLCIGFIWFLLEQGNASNAARLFLIIGVLGGFTTFSAFSMETLNLLREGAMRLAVINVLANNVLCVILAFVGYHAARLFN